MIRLIMVSAFAVVMTATSAAAFQEVGGPSGAPALSDSGGTGDVSDAPLATTPYELVPDGAATGAGEETGTSVSIPGLGTLGTLPKVDFGLELLYGAADQGETFELQDPLVGQAPEDDASDITIKGRIKHRF